MLVNAGKNPAAEDVRRQNQRSSSEVNAIIPEPEEGEVDGRDTILQQCTALLHAGNEALYKDAIFHRFYDPLSYIFIFPYREAGWHYKMLHITVETNGEEERVA